MTHPACPSCRSAASVVRIVCGYPSAETFAASERGEVYVGGCTVEEARWHCKKCRKVF